MLKSFTFLIRYDIYICWHIIFLWWVLVKNLHYIYQIGKVTIILLLVLPHLKILLWCRFLCFVFVGDILQPKLTEDMSHLQPHTTTLLQLLYWDQVLSCLAQPHFLKLGLHLCYPLPVQSEDWMNLQWVWWNAKICEKVCTCNNQHWVFIRTVFTDQKYKSHCHGYFFWSCCRIFIILLQLSL